MLENVRKKQFSREKIADCQCLIIIFKNPDCWEEQQLAFDKTGQLSINTQYDLMLVVLYP